MNPRLPLVVTTALTCLALQACEDRVQRVPGCETNDDCASPRLCLDGSCLDPERADVGTDGSGSVTTDAGQGGGEFDGGAISDTRVIPDVPAPRSCVAVRPELIDLGERVVGSRTVRSALVENCGRVDVTLQSAGIFDDDGIFSVVDFPQTPVVIGPGGSEPLIFSAIPVSAGVSDGTIELQVDDQALQVGLSVTGVGESEGGLCLRAPTSVSFGTVQVGAAVAPQVVVFENCGPLTVTDLQFVQPEDGSFRVVTDVPDRIEPGEALALQVELNTGFAANYLAELSLGNNEVSASTFAVASVIADAQSAGCLEVNPAAVDFGAVATSQELQSELLLSNCGTVPIEFSGAEVSALTGDSSWLEVGDLTLFVEPGAAQRLPLGFTPQAEGEWSALVLLLTVTPGVPPVVVPVTASVLASVPSPQP